jgi:hypothetical protein
MSRIYDSSQLTKRRAQQAIAGGFLTRHGSRPPTGIKDASILSEVKAGGMTEFIRYPTCIGISPGCPCGPLAASLVNPPYTPALPGQVSGITFTVGSIIVSWNAPTVGDGPFQYVVTPYLNDVAGSSVTTSETKYRFTDLQEWQPYTFTVCATNTVGTGPMITSPRFFAPPASLSTVMSGSSAQVDAVPSLQYVMNVAIDSGLQTLAAANIGPTRSSRMMYLLVASIVQAWNWVSNETHLQGVHDNWDWSYNKAPQPLGQNDSIIWMTCVIDYIRSFLSPSPSIYKCPADVVARVQAAGDWEGWITQWSSWYSQRQYDGSSEATTTQPTGSANWNQTIVVDGSTVSNIAAFPEPQQWTRLTVNGVKQNYATYLWDTVQSTCLTEQNESDIKGSISLLTGSDRDAEIDVVMDITAHLTDEEKVIAEFWAGSARGIMPPPLMSIWLWKEYMRSTVASCGTIMYSLLDLAIHMFEGGRITWALKGQFMQDRPIQEIRRRYAGMQIASWNGTVDGSQWTPYQSANFITPPFPDFPSGHSHFTKAFALTMTKWFGANITKHSLTYDLETLFCPSISSNETALYGDFVIGAGTSLVEPGPTSVVPVAPVVLSFSTWDEMANQAGMSRLYGGIHTANAHYASQTTAVAVDGFINSTWGITP